jgi:hypothetical protein
MVTIFYKTNNGTYISDSSWNLNGAGILGASHTQDSNGYYSIGLNVNDVPDSFARSFSTLTEVKIVNDSAPSSGYTIGAGAFYNVPTLKSVKIIGNCVRLERNCFYSCDNLESVELPNSIKEILEGAFSFCTSLKYIKLPDNIEYLYGCFYESGLESIFVPNDYCKFGRAVRYCKNIVEVDGVGGVNLIDDDNFESCTSLQKINLSDKNNKIPFGCFTNCTSLKEITIPSSITSLDYEAFYGCSSLEKITFLGYNAPTFKEKTQIIPAERPVYYYPTFEGVKENGTYYYPETNNDDYYYYGTIIYGEITLGSLGWNAETLPSWDINISEQLIKGVMYDNFIEVKSLFPFSDTQYESSVEIEVPEGVEYDFGGSLNVERYYTGNGSIYIPEDYEGTSLQVKVLFKGDVIKEYSIPIANIEPDVPYVMININSIGVPQNGGNYNVEVIYFYASQINTPFSSEEINISYNPDNDEQIENIGIKRSYYLSVPETKYERTISLKFSCLGVDGTSSASSILYLNQDGEINEDEDNEMVHPVWKDFIISFDDDAEFTLMDNNREFFKAHIYPKPNESKSKFYLNKIMQDYVYLKPLDALFSGSDVQYHNDGLKRIELKREGNNAITEYYFKYDYSYKDNNDLLLTEFILPYFVKGQYVLLTFRNETTETKYYSYQIGGIRTNVSINPFEYKTIKIYTGNNSQIVINGKQYPIVDACRTNYVIYYLNSKGGWCSLPVEGRVTKRDSLNTFEFTRNYNNTLPEFGRMRYLSEYNTTYTFNTGWIKEEDVEKVVDMLESNMLYVHILDDDKIVPLLLDNTNVDYKKKSLQEKLIYYQFEATTAQSKVRL